MVPAPAVEKVVPAPAVEKTTVNEKEEPVKSKQLKSGEEDYCTLFKAKAKLYRFRDNMWKERGVGFAKI